MSPYLVVAGVFSIGIVIFCFILTVIMRDPPYDRW